MAMNKRGFELSLNFLVTLLIAIVIFGFGVKFVYQLSSQAIELKDITSKELDARVADLLCTSSQKICIGTDKKSIQKGKVDVFGIKILNVGDKQNFVIRVTRPAPSGYTLQNQPIAVDELKWKHNDEIQTFERNEERKFGIGIEVPKTAGSGTYIFNVRVHKASDGVPYTSIQKLYVRVP